MADLPEEFYVEGFDESGGPRDVEFTLSFTVGGKTFEDVIKATVVHVEPFIDSDFTKPLDDYSKLEGLRSPKYLFGENDPVYIRVKNIGIDPDTAEYFYAIVPVKSPFSPYIYISLQETGIDTQVFTNLETGELLYISDGTDIGNKKTMVLSEEVLSFWLRVPPIGGGYKMSEDVMVDRAEIGVEWQDHYDYYNYATFIEGYGFSKELYDNINTYSGTTWFKNFKYDNLDSQESHWHYSSDSGYVDSVDIAVWAGHGTSPNSPYHVMWFFKDDWPGKEGCDPLHWTEIDWGDIDADWVFISTCSFLKGTNEELKQLVSSVTGVRGAHLICGFTNVSRVGTGKGTYLAEKLGEMSIKQAWFKYLHEKQVEGTTAKVFGAEECMDDTLAGSGPIETSRNPTIDSNWISVTETAD